MRRLSSTSNIRFLAAVLLPVSHASSSPSPFEEPPFLPSSQFRYPLPPALFPRRFQAVNDSADGPLRRPVESKPRTGGPEAPRSGLEIENVEVLDAECEDGEMIGSKCYKINRVAARHECPPEYLYVEGFCRAARLSQKECPPGFILTAANLCELTETRGCESVCPPDSFPSPSLPHPHRNSGEMDAEAGGVEQASASLPTVSVPTCVRSRSSQPVLYCTRGVLRGDKCVVDRVLKPQLKCARQTAVIEKDACVSATLDPLCGDRAARPPRVTNQKDRQRPMGDRNCLKIVSDPILRVCLPGYVLGPSGAFCIKEELHEPSMSCHAPGSVLRTRPRKPDHLDDYHNDYHDDYHDDYLNTHHGGDGRVSGEGGSGPPGSEKVCTGSELVHPLQSCAEGFTKTSIFGLCACQQRRTADPRIICPTDYELSQDLQMCVAQTRVQLACAPQHTLNGVWCEEIQATPPRLRLRLDARCTAKEDAFTCDFA